MIRVFYGEETYLIEKEIKKIKQEYHIEPVMVTTYDLEVDFLQDILEDANSISLFSNNKMIIVDNAYLFTANTSKKTLNQDVSLLEEYFQNPADTILIFVIHKEKLDERKKIVKLARKLGYVFEYRKVEDFYHFVTSSLKGYQYDKDIVSFFLDRVGEDLGIIEHEIEKLKIYKDSDKVITKDDIVNLTSKTINTNIFQLIENIVTDNKEKAMESYQEMIKLGQEPIMILILLANQFRLIYQSKKLYQKGYSKRDIATHLRVHPYAVEKALEKARLFTDNELLSYLQRLADLDIQIKSGVMNKEIALELFILDK